MPAVIANQNMYAHLLMWANACGTECQNVITHMPVVAWLKLIVMSRWAHGVIMVLLTKKSSAVFFIGLIS